MANDMDAIRARLRKRVKHSDHADDLEALIAENARLEQSVREHREKLVSEVARLTAEVERLRTEKIVELCVCVNSNNPAPDCPCVICTVRRAEAALTAERAAHSATKKHEDLLRKLLAERQAEVRQLRADFEALKATDAEIQRDQIAKTAALAAANERADQAVAAEARREEAEKRVTCPLCSGSFSPALTKPNLCPHGYPPLARCSRCDREEAKR